MKRYHRILGFFAGFFILISAVSGVMIQITKDETEEKEQQSQIFLQDSFLEKLLTPEALKSLHFASSKFKGRLREIHVMPKPNGNDLVLIIQNENLKKKIVFENFQIQNPKIFEFENETFIKRLHSGEILGDFGVGLSSAVGVIIIFLTLSGYSIAWPYLKHSSGGKVRLSLKKIFR